MDSTGEQKYQITIQGPTYGLTIGDGNQVTSCFTKTSIHPTPPKRVWNIPYPRNDYFTGREEILAELHARFKASNATALSQRTAMSGLGGIGKTQTAVEYAYRYHEEYQAVLWAHAESHEALTSSFVEIAGLLDLPQKDDQDQTIIVQAVKRWLQDNSGWLLILDNADEPKVVRAFLPTKCSGHILLTTRALALGGLAQRVEVDTFTPELGALFLLRRATIIDADGAIEDTRQSHREIAMQISEELGGLALALDQAGAYIEETACSLSGYLSLYRTQRAEVLKERGGLIGDHPEPVATTWSLSFQGVEEKNAAAADLLRLCVFLHPDAIPEEIVIKGAEHLGPRLQAMANDSLALNKAIAALSAYSLIRRDSAEKTLNVHRLVQAVLRDAMTNEETKVWAERAVLAVNKACPAVEFAQWSQWERYLPHILAWYHLIGKDQMHLPEVADLLTKMGWYLRERGQYQEAEAPLQQALMLREHNLGAKHLSTAQSLNSLAWLYEAQGQYEQAMLLVQRALAICEQQLGPQHPLTVSNLNSLAVLYDNQGKHEQAELLFQNILVIREQHLEPEHLDTAISLNNLAELYRSQGKYELAEPLHLRALSIYEKVLGSEHPNTAVSLHNLAALYEGQGKHEQAEPLYLRALAIRKKALGPEHPDTATNLHNLAALYEGQDKYDQAEPLYVQALVIFEQQLGSHHPDTTTCFNNLALLYHNQSKYEQAEPLYQSALTIYEQRLGPEHHHVAVSLNNLAMLYQDQGKYGQAKPLYIRALSILEQSLGPHHPNTQRARRNYAALLRAMGRNEEAKQFEEGNES